MTPESVLEDIRTLIAHKEMRKVGPGDQVTFLELIQQYGKHQHADLRKSLNELYLDKRIKVGPTMNGRYIKIL